MSTQFQEEQAERRETLENDRKVREQTGTFLSHTHLDDIGGRFAAISNPHIVGSTPIPKYPATGSHQHDPSGVEPGLGYRIDQMALEPFGSSQDGSRVTDGAEAPPDHSRSMSEHAAPSPSRPPDDDQTNDRRD
jgi:hypothetical protein